MLTTLVVFGVTTLAAQAPAPSVKCRKVEGEFVARKVACAAQLCTAGDLSGGLKGKYAFELAMSVTPVDFPPGAPKPPETAMFFVGKSTVTLKAGETLVGVDTGTIDMPPGSGGFASLITWTNGATGQIRVTGMFDGAKQQTSGEYEGTVCRPR